MQTVSGEGVRRSVQPCWLLHPQRSARAHVLPGITISNLNTLLTPELIIEAGSMGDNISATRWF